MDNSKCAMGVGRCERTCAYGGGRGQVFAILVRMHQLSDAALTVTLEGIHKGCPHLGGCEGASSNADRSGQKVGGRDLAKSGHSFQCGLCTFKKSFSHHLPALKIEK